MDICLSDFDHRRQSQSFCINLKKKFYGEGNLPSIHRSETVSSFV